jgi:hypothetical protein
MLIWRKENNMIKNPYPKTRTPISLDLHYAWERGYMIGLAEKERFRNPYYPEFLTYEAWNEGWEAAQNEKEIR